MTTPNKTAPKKLDKPIAIVAPVNSPTLSSVAPYILAVSPDGQQLSLSSTGRHNLNAEGEAEECNDTAGGEDNMAFSMPSGDGQMQPRQAVLGFPGAVAPNFGEVKVSIPKKDDKCNQNEDEPEIDKRLQSQMTSAQSSTMIGFAGPDISHPTIGTQNLQVAGALSTDVSRTHSSVRELAPSVLSQAMSRQIKELHRKFTTRTETTKTRTKQPPTPVSSDEEDNKPDPPAVSKAPPPPPKDDKTAAATNVALAAGVGDPHDPKDKPEGRYLSLGRLKIPVPNCGKFSRSLLGATFDPQNKIYLIWLFMVTLAVMYNYVSIPLRESFTIYHTPDTYRSWLICDYLADLIYLMDLLVFKTRVQFINSGVVETNFKECVKNYVKKKDFKLDLLALLPFDIFYLAVGIRPLLRLPRMLKLKTFWEMFDRLDQVAKSGHAIRILRTMLHMIYLIHLEACGYYIVSKIEGFGINPWVFDDKKNVTAYVFCFYLATKTATSIGNNPKPTNVIEYLFMTTYWLSGVFVFALLIGQIRDIFQAANANKTNYRKTMDITIWYMKSLNLPNHMTNKVRTWFNYNWEQQKTLNENSLLEGLPKKLKTDLAIHVHFHILDKVSLFQDCDRTLISDLILKLHPVLYLPGDYICKKGEVGTEMYIVMTGQVEVVGGPNNSIVFATLHEGSVFGEISLLALSGGNRRTADVRSKGFSTLFTLSKQDFEEAMQDYPAAYELLKKRSKKILNKNRKITKDDRTPPEEIIRNRQSTPKLLRAVVQAVEKTLPGLSLPKMVKGGSAPNIMNVTEAAKKNNTEQETTQNQLGQPDQSTDPDGVDLEKQPQVRTETEEDDILSLMSEESIHLPSDPEHAANEVDTPPPTTPTISGPPRSTITPRSQARSTDQKMTPEPHRQLHLTATEAAAANLPRPIPPSMSSSSTMPSVETVVLPPGPALMAASRVQTFTCDVIVHRDSSTPGPPKQD